MTLAKSLDTYIKIVKRALETTWAQKHWWALAAIAGLMHTGAVLNIVTRSFLNLVPADQLDATALAQISPIASWCLSYLRNLTLLETSHIFFYIVLSFIALILLTILALAAQYCLLYIVSKNKKEISYKALRKQLHHIHILRLFSVNAVMKILFTIIIGLVTLALLYISSRSIFTNTLMQVGIYTIALPLAFIVQIFGMLSLIQLVKKDMTLVKMFHKVANILHKNWLTALELSLILFAINFIASGLLFIIMLIIAIVAGTVFQLTLATGSYLLIAFVTFVTILFSTAIVIIYAGAITTFNYSAWTKLSDHLNRFPHFPALDRAIKKIIK